MSKYEDKDFYNAEFDRSSWKFLRKMDVGETVDIAYGRNECYKCAKDYGIRVSIRRIKTGDLQVKRLA